MLQWIKPQCRQHMMRTLVPPSYKEAMVHLLRVVIQYGELKRVHDLHFSPVLRAK